MAKESGVQWCRRLLAAGVFLMAWRAGFPATPARAAVDEAAATTAFKAHIEHIIVIYQENWSFDGLYGKFPGANGLANAGAATRQVDRTGQPYLTLPPPRNVGSIDCRFPGGLPVMPFDLTPYISPTGFTGDLVHRFYQEQLQNFANYADHTPAKAAHLKDEQDFTVALQGAALPHVCFLKMIGEDNEHPQYANLLRGQQHVADVVAAIQHSACWKESLIIITYDEHGGRWDHVAPPSGDRWGPGTRVPAIIISPFARRHYVDHTIYDTTAILKLIETRWDLDPLGTRDASANSLLNALETAPQ